MISPLPPEKPGESTYTANLIQEITKRNNIRIEAIAGLHADNRLDNEQVSTHAIWNGRSLSYPFTLLSKIRRLRPHIVHVQFGPHGKVYGGVFGEPMLLLLLLLRISGITTTMTLHSTWMPAQVRKRIEQHKHFKLFSILAIPFYILFMKLLNLGVSVLQLSTVRTNSLLREAFLASYGYNPKKVLEIPHPCGPAIYPLEKKGASKKLNIVNQKVILLFGFIRRGKGIELAIDAMERLSEKMNEVVLVIAGDTQDDEGIKYLNELKTRVKRKNLEDYVRFDTRYISGDDIGDYLSISTVILVPYSESVGASGPIHNFAIYGIPIIASDVGYHMRESIGGNIITFKNLDVEDLSLSLNRILNDDHARTEFSKKLVNYAKKETWKQAGKRTIRAYLYAIRDYLS